MNELVSIVIPCFNAAATVTEAVESAFGQTHKTLEVICVDDGSADGTLDILKRLREIHGEKLQIVAQANAGACAARNAGLHRARGEYVQFLDSDDVLLPEKIKHQIGVARSNRNPGIVAGSYVRRDLDGSERAVTANTMNPWVALPQVKLGITSANLFNRHAVIRAGGWDEQRQSSQEYDLMFRMLKSGSRVVFDPEPLTVVRKRQGSITTTNLEADTARRIEHVAEVRDYLRMKGEDQEAIQAADTALFDVIRSLCKWDVQQGIEVFNSYFTLDYRPRKSSATTRSYLAAYTMLGFRRAEKFRSILRSIRRSNSAKV